MKKWEIAKVRIEKIVTKIAKEVCNKMHGMWHLIIVFGSITCVPFVLNDLKNNWVYALILFFSFMYYWNYFYSDEKYLTIVYVEWRDRPYETEIIGVFDKEKDARKRRAKVESKLLNDGYATEEFVVWIDDVRHFSE